MVIKEISRNKYDDFLKKVETYSFLQTSEMKASLESNNRETKLLALVEDEEIFAVGLSFIRNFLGGKRIDFMVGASSYNEKYEYLFYDKMKDYAKENGYLKLVIKLDKDFRKYDQEGKPLTDEDYSTFYKMQELGYIRNDGTVPEYDGSPDYQFVKDLSDFLPDDYDNLLNSFNKNAQRKIKKAKELDIRVREIKKNEMEDFKSLTLETAKRQGFGDKSIDYYNTFYDEFSDKKEFLVAEINLNNSIKRLEEILSGIKENNKNKQRRDSLKNEIESLKDLKEDASRDIIPLANMILVYQNNQAIYFLGGSLTKYQKLPGPFILQFEAMKRIMKRGIKTYNFFGIDGVYDGSDGVLRFKQNFNGYIVRKTGAFIYYPFPKKYKSLLFLKKSKNKLSNI
ncbi:peptidoglycan bridge formation glycyltransferase FemA/FemB family protein [Anaerococcus sp. AGMB00486]|uniref:Peptidoglycan bridge formation glycyltransferase FemA/FemB family protein n=2 Tax=Anaerococcus TaxID=165779 RepID=A0ABX2N8X6_9FIRM|nr:MULTISPECIES: peptidoglycan bridge formation glycyltransferase FemA/FemB family protein [Anaerococcus]MSS77450.1 aminoacyltransferase [Anaerococcus porci]NVF11110.1 peptidoglycan bridge formation glycyltransferase FemA/FemB family protein [Anaerococcus faecalis]